MERQVLVIKTVELEKIVGLFEGYSPLPSDAIAKIEAAALWMNKNAAEKDPDFKQLIPYHVIRCANGNIFVYRRASEDDKYPEKRLQGMHSIGIGGHIDKKDGVDILKAAGREVGEEVKYTGSIANVQFIGGICMNDTEVNSVHFGLLFVINIDSNEISPNDKEIAWGEALPPDKIKALFSQEEINIEGWTKTISPFLL